MRGKRILAGLLLGLALGTGGALAQPLVPGAAPRWHGGTGIHTQRWQDEGSYYLDIQVRGIAPEDVQVIPRRGGLVIRVARLQARRHASPQGLRYERRSVARIEQWVTTPPDADLAHLTRQNLEGLVRIRIPRGRWGW